MKKVILVDGNNLMFRSYFATLYSGSIMTNNEGFPTNALYGFVNMMNKIISEENYEKIGHILITFEKKIKTFKNNRSLKIGKEKKFDFLKII